MTSRVAGVLLAVLVAGYAVLGLAVLAPEAVYSGDIGVKFVQARALAAHRFLSLDLPYPAERLDPGRDFFPIRPPFVMTSGGATQAIFPPASAAIQAVAVALGGLRGLIGLSIAAAAVVLYAASRIAPAGQRTAVLIALGIGSPLWFYAVSGWEHAPAVAFSTAAFACALAAPRRLSTIGAGLMLGAGSTLRDEVILLLPGILLVLWLRERAWKPLALTVAAALVPLVAAGILEVGWFGRPPAAHLRHAVHLAQKAAHVTSEPNPELPVREAFTPRQRYETVVQYWLLGYGNDRAIAWLVGGLALALLLRWRFGTSLGVLAWLLFVSGFAAWDLWEVATAPKWLAGLHRVSPYLVFALLPSAVGAERRVPLRAGALAAAAIYLIVAAVGVDTTGGKSLGPRLLLPLLPPLAVSAVAGMAGYFKSSMLVERLVGWTGAALVAMAALIHAAGTVPAYIARNRDDATAVRAAGQAFETWVVADEEFTAQLLLPLYYGKIVLLADTPELGKRLAERLDTHHVTRLIVVSRRATAQMSLRPFDLERIEPAGRMSIQYWQR